MEVVSTTAYSMPRPSRPDRPAPRARRAWWCETRRRLCPPMVATESSSPPRARPLPGCPPPDVVVVLPSVPVMPMTLSAGIPATRHADGQRLAASGTITGACRPARADRSTTQARPAALRAKRCPSMLTPGWPQTGPGSDLARVLADGGDLERTARRRPATVAAGERRSKDQCNHGDLTLPLQCSRFDSILPRATGANRSRASDTGTCQPLLTAASGLVDHLPQQPLEDRLAPARLTLAVVLARHLVVGHEFVEGLGPGT